MLRASSNEISQIARKACLGIGLAEDRAVDLAAATIWLMRRDADGAGVLTAMLLAADTALPIQYRVDNDGLHCPKLRPSMEGVAAIDWLIATGEKGSIHSDGVDFPLMMLGLLGVAATSYNLEFRVNSVLVTRNRIEGALAEGAVTIRLCASKTPNLTQTSDITQTLEEKNQLHLPVDETIWESLSALAFKTYVPASTESRLKGAGAGLFDND